MYGRSLIIQELDVIIEAKTTPSPIDLVMEYEGGSLSRHSYRLTKIKTFFTLLLLSLHSSILKGSSEILVGNVKGISLMCQRAIISY